MSAQRPGATSILQAVERRGEADARPSYFVYAVLPLVLLFGAFLVIIAALVAGIIALDDPDTLGGLAVALFGFFLVAAAAGAILTVIGLYKLIKRRNQHFARDHLLRQGTLELCRDVAERAGGEAVDDLEAMERIHNEAQLEENERSPALHLILYFLVPLWSWYVVYFLLKDPPRHTRRQARFTRHAAAVVAHEGHEVPQVPAVKEHSFVLALIASAIIPFWFFVVLYWLYNDPNEHFDAQWSHEDALVEVARSSPAPPAVPGAGEAAPEGAGEPAAKPAFTVWACPDCAKKYKVPPKRPVRVTCKNCGHQEILRE